ncbi:DUF1294 domain-containing protein [Phenylobacterium sp.]|jgi:uncharacterized membrane protein YsdA (DUF1294 family)|uniref:DUF1294 domain-containing protein n=1 Tax=Phenylobacterium sp. TaxID=1871053 RepID=UPI002F945C35
MILFAALYLVVINVGTYAAFADDKRRAVRGDRRAPERTLLELAVMGGAVGAIAAQQLLRHKTSKEPFRTRLLIIAVVQALALGALAWWAVGRPQAWP